MTDLAEPLRGWLTEEGLAGVAEATAVHTSSDTTRKMLLRLHDGATIETVHHPAGKANDAQADADAAAADEDEDDANVVGIGSAPEGFPPLRVRPADTSPGSGDRVTQCISTQVGCAMGCMFCASGVAGLKRHLGAHEIVAQVILG